ncbi:MAG TPA: glycoside hydrolase family 172 protein [Ignavibacteriales bacterium]|nr:glycoside hydrolase family 172 protein [Ignavibacteriales bacterium]
MKKRIGGLIILVLALLTETSFGQLDNILSPSRLPYLKHSKLIQVSSYDTTGGNNDRMNIPAGETATIFNEQGPGVITRIWFTIDSRDPYFLRRILLRIYWDGEQEPSVEVPVGDFFGSGFEYTHYVSQFLGMTSGGYICYFPMPFNKSARMEVVNGTGQEILAFYYNIAYQKMNEPLSADAAYFHAQWKRDIKTGEKDNYVVFGAAGEGHFVGLSMSMQSYAGDLYFLEGDEMVYVDGEKFPSVYGTGTEDYFNSGWYYSQGVYYAPYNGLLVKDEINGRIATYRYNVGDAIPFTKSILFTIEHGPSNTEIGDYSSTAYWYQKEPHRKFPAMLPASLRIPLRAIVPPNLIAGKSLKLNGAKSEAQNMDQYGPEWFGYGQLKADAKNPGDEFSITIPTGFEKAYNISLYLTKGPGYGAFEFYHAGKKYGEINCDSTELLPNAVASLENIPNGKDNIKIDVRLKDGAQGSSLGIVAVKLTPVRNFIPEWALIGPFPNARKNDIERYGIDNIFPPEKEIDFTRTYEGANGQTAKWDSIKTPKSGYVSLTKYFDPYELIISYAFTYIYSPEEQTVPLFISSDDGSKVFLNDKELYRFLDVRIAAPDNDKIDLHLKKGWNKLLLKIENNLGGYGFYARIVDIKDNLKLSLDKK